MELFEHLKDVDLSTFLDFPTACSYRSQPSIRIFEDGRVVLYGDLRKNTAAQRDYCARISLDGRCIALYPQLTPNIRFHTDGRSVRQGKLLRFLRNRMIEFPAVYEMEWVEQEKAWIGCCAELPEPNLEALRRSMKQARQRRRP